jgi:hypothetical protein
MRKALAIMVLAGLACGVAGAETAGVKSRAVSLTVFQKVLQETGGEGPRELCGLTRVEGYVVDGAHRDVVILGKVDPAAPPLHTEDFAIALRSAWLKYAWKEGGKRYYANPGCSIDPDPAVMQELSGISARIGATQDPEAMEELLARWCEVSKRPQTVRVKGVPRDSHFAAVMVQADYELKRLVDGSVTLQTPGVMSLVDRIMEAAKEDLSQGRDLRGPANAMSRFWFFPGKAQFAREGDAISIVQCPVVLLTEEQYLSGSGVAGKGRPEPTAREFAESFSARYAAVAQEQPIYQELEGLFRLVTLAKLMKYQNVKVDLRYFLERHPVAKTETPRTLPGMCRVRRFEQSRETATGTHTSYLWMPSCGGVSMEVKIKPSDFVKTERPSPRRGGTVTGKSKGPAPSRTTPPPRKDGNAALKSRPSSKSLYWDY